ncbi:MAG TPA: biotin/lipoyl-binding protein, partial [Pseudomonadales bacterium]|nr:biotin/lipoyl-binding protein [Pseudomonadales bacterium]
MKTFLLSSILLLVAGCQLGDDRLASLGTLEVHRVSITADSSEPIVAVPVKEGDVVEPGDVLMRQDPTRMQASLDKAEADAAAAKAALDKAQNGPRKEEIDAARAKVAAATSDVRTAKLELDRAKSLVKQNYASQSNVDIL